jgi:hypothetical protein
MRIKIMFFFVLCIVAIVFGYIYFKAKKAPPSVKIHYHAGFLVYVENNLQDFSGSNFMNIDFCLTSHTTDTHLHDNVGDVVHVHRTGAVWGDLFTNMRYSFPSGKSITGYINGQSVPDILHYPIKPYNSIIITVGDNSSVDLTKSVPKSHILDIEKRSEGCSV